MYRYDEFDRTLVLERVEQFRGQVARRLSGELEEDEFKQLRLRNGLYLQLHAYMLRVAIPYGTLSSRQMRKLGHIARKYDRDYGHFTTRQNIQYNWPKLVDVPDILSELAEVEMHARTDRSLDTSAFPRIIMRKFPHLGFEKSWIWKNERMPASLFCPHFCCGHILYAVGVAC